MTSKSLAGKVVVVTGGTAGLGRATATAFAKRGAHVAVLARDADRLHETTTALARYGVRTMAVSVDVADAAGVEAAAEESKRSSAPSTSGSTAR